MLKGTLVFRGSTMDQDYNFMDIDNSIAARLQISSLNWRQQDRGLPENIPVPLLADFGHFESRDEKESSFMGEGGEVEKPGDTTAPAGEERLAVGEGETLGDQAERDLGPLFVKEGEQPADDVGENVFSSTGSNSRESADKLRALAEPIDGSEPRIKETELSAFTKLSSLSSSSPERLGQLSETTLCNLENKRLEETMTRGDGGNNSGDFSSSPNEHAHLQDFVFVNRDGTAQRSPSSARHPLEHYQDEKPGDGWC